LSEHLALTDNEITAALLHAACNGGKRGSEHARRIIMREHYKVVYERIPTDVRINPEAGKAIFDSLVAKFGSELFRHDRYPQRSGPPDFPVRTRDGEIVSSLAISETLNKVPVVSIDCVFADRSILGEASKWLEKERQIIIAPEDKGESNG